MKVRSFSLTGWNNLNYIHSVVGIATGCGLDGLGIESLWEAKFFRTCPDQLWDQPILVYNEYRVFPGGIAAWA